MSSEGRPTLTKVEDWPPPSTSGPRRRSDRRSDRRPSPRPTVLSVLAMAAVLVIVSWPGWLTITHSWPVALSALTPLLVGWTTGIAVRATHWVVALREPSAAFAWVPFEDARSLPVWHAILFAGTTVVASMAAAEQGLVVVWVYALACATMTVTRLRAAWVASRGS